MLPPKLQVSSIMSESNVNFFYPPCHVWSSVFDVRHIIKTKCGRGPSDLIVPALVPYVTKKASCNWLKLQNSLEGKGQFWKRPPLKK